MEETKIRDEAELESLIRKNPGQLEAGLIFLTERKTTGRGRLAPGSKLNDCEDKDLGGKVNG